MRKETGENQAGLGANESAVEEPNLCLLPAWREVGVGGGRWVWVAAERGWNVKRGGTRGWRIT